MAGENRRRLDEVLARAAPPPAPADPWAGLDSFSPSRALSPPPLRDFLRSNQDYPAARFGRNMPATPAELRGDELVELARADPNRALSLGEVFIETAPDWLPGDGIMQAGPREFGGPMSPATFEPADAPFDPAPFSIDEEWRESGAGERLRPFSSTPPYYLARPEVVPRQPAAPQSAAMTLSRELPPGPMPAYENLGRVGAQELARQAGERASADYSPLNENFGWIDNAAGAASSVYRGVRDLVQGLAGDEEAQRRSEERGRHWGQALNDVLLHDPYTDPNFPDESPLPQEGSLIDRLWIGPARGARQARYDSAYNDAMADFESAEYDIGWERGELTFPWAERAARDAARAARRDDAMLTGPGLLEFVPGVGLVDVATDLTRAGLRTGLRATGTEAPRILQAPVREVGPATQAARDQVFADAMGYGGGGLAGYALADAASDSGEMEPWAEGLGAAGGALLGRHAPEAIGGMLRPRARAPRLADDAPMSFEGAPGASDDVIDVPFEELPIPARATADEPLQAQRVDAPDPINTRADGRRMFGMREDGTIDPRGLAFGAGAGVGLGLAADELFNDEAYAGDGETDENGIPYAPIVLGTGLGLAGAASLFGRGGQQFARELGSEVGAGARGAPRRRWQAAVRDPETGRVYTGVDHAEAIDAIPEEAARARLQSAYDADPSFGGFVVDGQYMGREEGLAAMRPGAADVPLRTEKPSAVGSQDVRPTGRNRPLTPYNSGPLNELINQAEMLARESGGQLPRGWHEIISERMTTVGRPMAPGSVKSNLMYMRGGQFNGAYQRRAQALQLQKPGRIAEIAPATIGEPATSNRQFIASAVEDAMNNGRSWPRPKDVLDDLNSHRRDHGLGPMKYDYVNGVLSELRGKHGRRGTFGRSRTNDGTATAIAGGVGLGGALLAGTQNAEASDGSESDWDWGLPAAVGGGLAAVGGLYALTRGRGARRIGEVIPESEAIPDEVVPMSAVPDTGPSPARSVPDGGSAGAGRIPTRLSVEIEQPRGQTGSRYRLELDGQKNGFVTVTDDGDAWSVNNSYLDSDLRGQGHGVRMYEDLAERARQAGARTLRSDHSVSPDAQNAWMGLERRGYAVQRIDGPDGPRFEVDLTRSPSRGPDGGSAGASSAIDGPNGGPSGTTQALIGGAGLTGALALGASDAEADDILPLPDGLDFRQGSWEEPSWTPVELPDGTSAMSREMTGPDGRTYIIIAEQGADASINVLGYMNPASISDAGWGVAPPSTEPAQEEEAEEEDSLDLSDLRIPGAILAGVGARQGLRSLGVRAIPAEIGGSLTASGAAYAVDPDDPLGSIAIGALNPLAGRFADHLGGEVRRIGAAATRHLDELPEPVRGYEFDRDLRAPGIDDVIDTERAQEGREIQLRMAAESGEETRRRARALDPNAIPDGPPADFTERRGGREVSVFGEPAKPRERAPLPPLDERAAEQGAQGALRGVTPTKLREIADDLGIEAEGRGAADLRRTLVRELGRRFDSTKELIAFLGRYGVSAALVGVVANGEATAPSR